MIIANLIGGLGNQMFQYACARALAVELKLPLKVTLDMFGAFTFHNGPELEHVFSPKLDVASPAELRSVIGAVRALPVVRRVLANNAFDSLRGKNFIAEPYYSYWDGLLDRVRSGGYLQGYWQSARYFTKHAAIIRGDFTFRQQLTGFNAELERAIRGSVAVSVHVRRGDYANNAKTHSMHGTCTPEYYFKAIERVRQRMPMGTRFFAFSDDPQWVTDVLIPCYPDLVLVANNRGENDYNDMRLMSLCNHNIIANSSFSWWAAWLNDNKEKIVIAPRRWFANDTDTRDLIPQEWELMDNLP
jgi:hypothetical protein